MFDIGIQVIWFSVALFFGMLLMLEVGRKVGIRHRLQDPEGAEKGLTALDGAVYGLMGLLMAFTFSVAAARFDKRRELLVDEVNNIGTAYLRLELLPASVQPALRDNFRRYVDSRLAVYRAIPDIEAVKAKLNESGRIQSELWTRAVTATQSPDVRGPAVTSLLLSAINEMIDITTVRTVALQTHIPVPVFGMLGALVLCGSLISGYGMAASKGRSWLHVISFTVLMTGVLYIILDLEYPRAGFIRVDEFDYLMVDLRDSMK